MPKPEVILARLLNQETTQSLKAVLASEFRALYQDSTTDSQIHRKAFEIYLQHRLALLGPLESRAIRAMLASRFEVSIHNRPDLTKENLSGFFSGNSVSLKIPRIIAGSPLDYAIRIHEIEHAIQALYVRADVYSELNPKYFPVLMFHAEKGAMTAEALFLGAIPRSVMESVRERIQLNADFSGKERDFILGVADDTLNSSSVEDYLSAQWSRGRYSRTALVRKQARRYTEVGVTAISLGLVGGLVWHFIDFFVAK